jgi:hypothetical protein
MLDLLKELILNVLHLLGLAWWVELKTELPRCVYYFGPFISAQEAKDAQSGYVEDLKEEKAEGITVVVRRCKPTALTIFDEPEELGQNSLRSLLKF